MDRREFLKKGIYGTAELTAACIFLPTPENLSLLLSEKIESSEDAERILEEEKKKLKMDKPVRIRYYRSCLQPTTGKLPDGTYDISL